MKNFDYVLMTVAVLGLMATSVSADVMLTYDFESLNGGTSQVANSIYGQDGWSEVSGDSAGYVLIFSEADIWGENQAAYRRVIGNTQIARPNSIENMGDVTELSCLLRARDNPSWQMTEAFGLRDCDTGQTAFTYGLSNHDWFIQAADGGTITTVPTGLTSTSEGYLAVLRVDTSAYGGDGAGSLFLQNLSVGGSLTAVSGLQDINLGILSMDNGPSGWDGLYMSLSGGGATLDNLSVTYETVPEPGTMVLLLVGAVYLAATRFRRRNG